MHKDGFSHPNGQFPQSDESKIGPKRVYFVRPIIKEGYMFRLSAIALLCIAISAPALASNEELAPADN